MDARFQTSFSPCVVNTLRPRRNEQHFADDIFKRIFFNANIWILIKIILKFVPKGPIDNIPALVQIMAWRRSGDKPLSESMMVSLPTHICVTGPQWVNTFGIPYFHICFLEWQFLTQISLTFVHVGPINNNTTLVHIMAWHRTCYKQLSEPIMRSFLTNTRVTRLRWAKPGRGFSETRNE